MHTNKSQIAIVGSTLILSVLATLSCKPRRNSSLADDGAAQMCTDIGPSLGIELLKKDQFGPYPYADFSTYLRSEDKNLENIPTEQLLVRATAPLNKTDKNAVVDMFFYPTSIKVRNVAKDGSQAPGEAKDITLQPGVTIKRVWLAPTQTFVMLLLNEGQNHFLRTYATQELTQQTSIAGFNRRASMGARMPQSNFKDIALDPTKEDVEVIKYASWYDGALAWVSASGQLSITESTVTSGRAVPRISPRSFAERTNEELKKQNVKALHAAALSDHTMLIVGSGLAVGEDKAGSLQLYAMSLDKGLIRLLDLKGVGSARPKMAISPLQAEGSGAQYFTIEHISLDNRIRLKLYHINTKAPEINPVLLGDVSTGLNNDRGAKRAALMFEEEDHPILLVSSQSKRMRIDVTALFQGKQYDLKKYLGFNVESRFVTSTFDRENGLAYVATSQDQIGVSNFCLSAKKVFSPPVDMKDGQNLTIKAMKVVTGSFDQQQKFLLVLTDDGRLYRYDVSDSRIGVPPQKAEGKLLMDFGRDFAPVDFGQAHLPLESKGVYCYVDGSQLWRFGFPCEADPDSLKEISMAVQAKVGETSPAVKTKIFDSIGGSYLNHYVLRGDFGGSLAYADKGLDARQLRFDHTKDQTDVGGDAPASALAPEHLKSRIFLLTRPREAEALTMPVFNQICESRSGKENTRYLFDFSPQGVVHVGYNDEMGNLHGFKKANFKEGTREPKLDDFRCFDSFKDSKGADRFLLGGFQKNNVIVIHHGDLERAHELKWAREFPRIVQPSNSDVRNLVPPKIKAASVVPTQIGETYDVPVIFSMYEDFVMQVNSFQPQLDLYLE